MIDYTNYSAADLKKALRNAMIVAGLGSKSAKKDAMVQVEAIESEINRRLSAQAI